MSAKDVLVWLLARKTKAGSKYLYGEERERRIQLLGKFASDAYHTSQAQQGRDVQYENDEVKVLVKNDWDRRRHCYVADILVIPRDGSGDRYHVVIDGSGNELLNEYHHGR